MSEILPAAQRLFSTRPTALVAAFAAVYHLLVDELGCEPRVKTIYVGFSRSDKMIAAIHPNPHDVGLFEIALPAAATSVTPAAYDAPHLKWPMLPVAIAVADDAESLEAALDVIRAVATAAA